MNQMSKYEPLWNWIKENGTDSFKLTFDEIEIIFRESKRIYKPQKLSVSGVFLLSIIVFSCGETQKILYRKQRVNSR